MIVIETHESDVHIVDSAQYVLDDRLHYHGTAQRGGARRRFPVQIVSVVDGVADVGRRTAPGQFLNRICGEFIAQVAAFPGPIVRCGAVAVYSGIILAFHR